MALGASMGSQGQVGVDAPRLLARRARPHGPGALLPHRWQAERLWTQSGTTRFHARVALQSAPPEAPAVVLLHGLGSSSRALTPTLMHLAPFCRAYAPDLPGFGLTPGPRPPLDLNGLADALARWMQATGVGPVSLLASSTGCQTAVRFALRHPERLDKLILQSPTLDTARQGALRRLGRSLLNASSSPSTQGARLEELLPEVHLSSLVVVGARDALVPESWARRVVELLPRGRLVIIPGAAHALPCDSPLELVRVVRPFLEAREHPPGPVERMHP